MPNSSSLKSCPALNNVAGRRDLPGKNLGYPAAKERKAPSYLHQGCPTAAAACFWNCPGRSLGQQVRPAATAPEETIITSRPSCGELKPQRQELTSRAIQIAIFAGQNPAADFMTTRLIFLKFRAMGLTLT
jgi:hypothetical protein